MKKRWLQYASMLRIHPFDMTPRLWRDMCAHEKREKCIFPHSSEIHCGLVCVLYMYCYIIRCLFHSMPNRTYYTFRKSFWQNLGYAFCSLAWTMLYTMIHTHQFFSSLSFSLTHSRLHPESFIFSAMFIFFLPSYTYDFPLISLFLSENIQSVFITKPKSSGFISPRNTTKNFFLYIRNEEQWSREHTRNEQKKRKIK